MVGRWTFVFLGGGFKHLLFSTLPGEMIQFDDHIFQMGWNHQPEIAFSCQGLLGWVFLTSCGEIPLQPWRKLFSDRPGSPEVWAVNMTQVEGPKGGGVQVQSWQVGRRVPRRVQFRHFWCHRVLLGILPNWKWEFTKDLVERTVVLELNGHLWHENFSCFQLFQQKFTTKTHLLRQVCHRRTKSLGNRGILVTSNCGCHF